jgi:uncharacterized protein
MDGSALRHQGAPRTVPDLAPDARDATAALGDDGGVKYVLLYESADDVLRKAPEHFEAHSARGQEFHQRGSLVAYGPFGDPQEQGSMAVFTTREAAEEFARGDPFVLNGVVRDWQVREWDEAFLP